MEAAQHPLQAERLSALYSYEILDTDREKDFDDIAQLAAAICGTQIAVVNLVDDERQWFKAETGLGVRETPIATSICSHAILEKDFIEINDTLKDSRTILNPLCCGDLGLRFYAGALLKTAEGLPIGTLCVLDYEPRALDPVQRDTLRVLAKQVMAQLEMRKALKQAKILRQEVDHRVKNSLQTLASFVRLQARSFGSVEAEQAFNAVLTRIDAVAKLHEQLYRSDTGPRVDLGQYAGYLGEYLAGLAPPNISVHVRSDRVTVDTSQAVAVGTLINEFAANSFKHAFPDERIGMVETQISTLPCGKVSLVCSDNGIGLPEDVATRGGGLGMKIAELVAMELRSNLRIDSGGEGLRFHLEFQPS